MSIAALIIAQSIVAQAPAVAYTDAQAQAANAAAIAAVGAQIPSAAQMAAAAPVQSVNANVGAVTVPTLTRKSCVISTFTGTSSGAGSCSFGYTYSVAPNCWASITSAASGYVYSAPVVSATTTAASVIVSAATSVLNISLGATTVWSAPPAGTSITMACVG